MMSLLRLSEEELRSCLDVIRILNPHPGSDMTGGEPQYISPEVCVRKAGDDFVIFLYDDGLPGVRMTTGMESQARRQDVL